MTRYDTSMEKVLIVDDDSLNIGYLGPILKDAGYSVLAVQSAEKVLPLVRAKMPDIVLLDVTMPQMSGYDLCKLIHGEPGAEHIPVIFITGRSSPADVVKGFEAGGADYLLKPVNRVELLARMRNHLDRLKYEGSLTDEKERFRVLTENVGEAFLLLDMEARLIHYANPAFDRIFGFALPSPPTSAQPLEAAFGEEQIGKIRASFRGAVVGSPSIKSEFTLQRPDGSLRWVWSRASLIDYQGERRFVVVIEDITERKAAEIHLRENLEQEAKLAGTIQQTLLMNVDESPPRGIETVFVSMPSKDIDGDFYSVFTCGDRFDIVVGDVMGKGLNAALVGVAAKERFLRAYAKLLGSRDPNDSQLEPARIVTMVNHDLAGKLIQLNSFVTFQYLRFVRPLCYLEYVDCGHMPIILWDGETCWSYKGTNSPLGFFQDQDFESFRIPLRSGNIFIVYSDGVTEAKAPDGSYFGEARLHDTICRYARLGPGSLVQGIQAELTQHLKGLNSSDDVTLAVFSIGPEPRLSPALHDVLLEFTADLGRLGEIRKAAEAMLAIFGPESVDDRARDMAILAVDEVATNVIVHGLGARKEERFLVRLEAWESWYSISFRYSGEDFDWARDHQPSIEALDEGGYGMFLVKSAMKSYVVARSCGGLMDISLSNTVRGVSR